MENKIWVYILMVCIIYLSVFRSAEPVERQIIHWDQGWGYIEKGITKLKRIVEDSPEAQPPFTSEEFMTFNQTINIMCTQEPPYDYSQQLYDKHRQVLEEYITSTVLPSLKEKRGETLLRELVKRWKIHKAMVRWLSRFFHFLNRRFIVQRSLPTLYEVGMTCFHDLVYQQIKEEAADVVIILMDKEREGELKGEQIDRALLKDVVDIFVEIGMGKLDIYDIDFEQHVLAATSAYYSRKALNWIVEHSCPDYMLKVEECLKNERDRASVYLHSSGLRKLVEKVQMELLAVYLTPLLENEHSGYRVLLRDDKVDDLSRMFRLYHEIPGGLEPVANIFKQHITAQGSALVQQAEDAARIQVLTRNITELHDKYTKYVTDCFLNHPLFRQALKEAFENFRDRCVDGNSSSVQLGNIPQ